jgi:hypothetical protein
MAIARRAAYFDLLTGQAKKFAGLRTNVSPFSSGEARLLLQGII